MAYITFRNSKIIYYGPHPCENCGEAIVKMATEFGGTAFTQPSGTVYPNTEWHPHVCDPMFVLNRKGVEASLQLKERYPKARAIHSHQQGWLIVSDDDNLNLACGWPNSDVLTYIGSEALAWIAARDIAYPEKNQEPV